MVKEAITAETSSTTSPAKKRRFPIPFRKKHPKSNANADEGGDEDPKALGKHHYPHAPLNGSSGIPALTVSSTAAAAVAPTHDFYKEPSTNATTPTSSSRSGQLKVTIVEPPKLSRKSAAASSAIKAVAPPPMASVTTTQQKLPPPVKTSWLCRTKFFQGMCEWAFTVVDHDGSGQVDEKELYSGLLLIHLKLGSYAGPAACKPLELGKVRNIFNKYDVDNSGSLDKEEFQEVMMVLFGNVLLRVLVQWSMTLLIVPLVASKLLEGIYWVWDVAWQFIVNLDNYNEFASSMEIMWEELREVLWDKTPLMIKNPLERVLTWIDAVPDSIWSTVPLTLLSCILGIVVVPYMIFSIDEYFQKVADRKSPTPPAKMTTKTTTIRADKKNK